MKSKLFVAVLALAVCSAVLLGGVAGASNRAATTVTINENDALNSDLHGLVKSHRRSCKRNRLVKVYKQTGGHQNLSNDTKVLSDRAEFSNGKYRWDTGNSGQPNGKYYAHVSRTHRCKADNSRTVRVHHS